MLGVTGTSIVARLVTRSYQQPYQPDRIARSMKELLVLLEDGERDNLGEEAPAHPICRFPVRAARHDETGHHG
jgi:hypothetical protein